MRNVAFSILLFALAVVQIAVVSAELPRSHADARVVLASNETGHNASTF